MHGTLEQLLATFDATAPALLAQHRLPGIAIAVLEGGELAACRCYGHADVQAGTPIDTSTRFNIASISKAVAAWGVLALHEAGKVDLDAPVDTYLSRWHLPASDFDASAVTVRRLLSHTAGINLPGCSASPLDTPPASLVDILNGRVGPIDLAQVAYSKVWDIPLDSYNVPVRLIEPPGTGYRYSGGGYLMLELLIEDITGRSFADYMAGTLFRPLGMSGAGFDPTPHAAMATAHSHLGEPLGRYRTNGLAAGGMVCTIADLATFALASMPGAAGEPAGRGVLRPETVALMHTPVVDAEHFGPLLLRYGLGHSITVGRNGTAAGHTGGNLGWRSAFYVLPAHGKGIAMLLNGAAGNDVWQALMRDWQAHALARG